MSKTIQLTKGMVTVVDDWWYDYLMQWKWCAMKDRNTFYAFRMETKNGKQTGITMHRVVNKTPKGMVTDHIDCDGLNNQEHNLRTCTSGQNICNTKARSRSGFKGVSKRGNRWRASLSVRRKKISLGMYDTAEEAALAYDKGAKQYVGEFAHLNFPERGGL
jgi:hypothetical protein